MRRYIEQRLRVFLLFLVCGVIFLISFILYHLPMKAVLYPMALCLLLIGIWAFFDYKKCQMQWAWLHDMEVEKKELEDCIVKEEQRYDDMIAYYTVWAHQIKTPIAAMNLTLQNEDSPLSRRMLGELFRIEQYVEMVLAFLRLGSESSDFIIKEYSLDKMIKESLRKFAGQFIDKRLSITYEPMEKKILTDEKWFALILEQILSNAVKYTQTGGVTITLEENILCIKDSGIGIAKEDLPRIFEKGYTGYNGRRDKKASGIGLHLCKCACDKLNHRIWADSVLGEGTSFYIDLERYQGEYE